MSNQSNIKLRIQEDIKDAMRTHEQHRRDALRFLSAAIKRLEIDKRIELNDDQVLSVIEKQIKQHRDSIEQYEKAGRNELAEKEKFELDILQHYMPEPLAETEIDKLIQEAINATNASSIRDMGKVMGLVKTKMQGRADMSIVSTKIKTLLSS
jgi:uncharacterized protein